MKPNFLFIGPDKSGSTWLYKILSQHPECYVPPCKDLYFFDRYYERGMKWYLSFFNNSHPGARAIGEFSHDYLFSRDAADRILHDLPDVKLLTCLRNPVERTFSHYLFMVRSGRTRDSFEIALDKFPELINNSMYDEHLSRYFLRFDRDQLKVLFFEDLKSDPKAFAGKVFDFLELTYINTINYDQQILPASRPRSFLLSRIVKWGTNFARQLGLVKLVGNIKHSQLTRFLYKPYEISERPQISPATRNKLKKKFLTNILRLEDMLGVELLHWLNEKTEKSH